MAHHKKKKKNKHHRHQDVNHGNEARIDRSADEVEFANEPGFAADEVVFPEGVPGAVDEVEFGEEAWVDRQDNRIRDDRNAYGDRWGMEAATETAPVDGPIERERDGDADQAGEAGRGLGIFSVVLSVLSFFMVPFLLGAAGIVLGIISARRGSRWGMWAVGIGVVSIILTAFIAPITGF
ncbi:hypothetical protein [Desmospora activa]|uniref:DUF4190 domain-containing protein n=1 Tax=Desmospora activa DSM 45169 TaxID=1121389 RepID=A0A2T4ZC03_9BACL|nr:hypothetical protein [Desmospora activa]PTM59423.1 hypothetical protein C8J48_2044 [Desmospora activa DSM 45169]